MIKELELNGFKSFVNDQIEFKDLTLLTGLNSSGKSSVIQALLLLEKAANKSRIYLPGHGNITESKNAYVTDGISITGNFDGGKIEIHNDTVIANSVSSFPEIIHIVADRFGPETSVSVDSTSSKLGKRGENIFKVIEENADKPVPVILKHEKSQGDTFLFNLEAWLSIVSPNVSFKSFVENRSDSSYGTFNGHRSKNVGFGLSYTLTVITALLLSSLQPDCIVIIENPEAHLHPRGQTEIARLIALCAESGAQVIIETHSDHLFDGIRLYVKGHSEFAAKVRPYWFELDKKGNTNPTSVDIDTDGRTKDCPPGMFDQFFINASKLL